MEFVRVQYGIVVRLFAGDSLIRHISRRVSGTLISLHLNNGSDSRRTARNSQQAVSDRRPPPAAVLGRRTPRSESSATAGASRPPHKPVSTIRCSEIRSAVDADACDSGIGRLQEADADPIPGPLSRPRYATALTREYLAEFVSYEEVDDEVDRRVESQKNVGEAVGSHYERIHVDHSLTHSC